MLECGTDVAFNYKTTSTEDILAQHGPINLCVEVFVYTSFLYNLIAIKLLGSRWRRDARPRACGRSAFRSVCGKFIQNGFCGYISWRISPDLWINLRIRFTTCATQRIYSWYFSSNVHWFELYLQNYPNILFKSLNVQGFIVSNILKKYNDAFYTEIPSKVASGEIKYLEYTKRGLEASGQTLLDVLTGKNTGKAIIVVADK